MRTDEYKFNLLERRWSGVSNTNCSGHWRVHIRWCWYNWLLIISACVWHTTCVWCDKLQQKFMITDQTCIYAFLVKFWCQKLLLMFYTKLNSQQYLIFSHFLLTCTQKMNLSMFFFWGFLSWSSPYHLFCISLSICHNFMHFKGSANYFVPLSLAQHFRRRN